MKSLSLQKLSITISQQSTESRMERQTEKEEAIFFSQRGKRQTGEEFVWDEETTI